MPRPLTIVMYHYVRNPSETPYRGLKARTVTEFRAQLRHIAAEYTPVTMEQVIQAIHQPDYSLPERPILLTFDDGYIDHYETVFPLLAERGWQGAFFPPARPIVEGRLLDVNKLHFVLASTTDTTAIVGAIFNAVDGFRAEFGLDEGRAYWNRVAVADRFDSADVIFVKRMLQRELPETLRAMLLTKLFRELVATSEVEFARRLYMSVEQLQKMARAGMFIGSHGSEHYWMDRLTPEDQASEIDASMKFLDSLGCRTDAWVMCYPYGAWNMSLLDALRQRKCAAALTVEVAVADLDVNDPLTLPRLDTNDLPVTG